MGEIIGGIDVVPPAGAEALPPVEAGYGLLIHSAGGYHWTCHEAISEPKAQLAPRYVRSATGIWLATLSDVAQGRGGHTLFRSADGGCSWDEVTGVPEGAQIVMAAFSPASSDDALAASNTPGVANRVFRSADAGTSWAAETPTAPDRRFHSVGFASDRGWATATDDAGARAFWWREGEGGDWSETEITGLPEVQDARFAVLDARDGEVWAVLDPTGDDTLLHSPDGGGTWSPLVSGRGLMTDAAGTSDGLWLVLNNGIELVHVSRNGTVRGPIEGFVPAFGLGRSDDTLWFPSLSSIAGPLLVRSDLEASAFEVLAYPDDIVAPLVCDAGTQTAEVCAPLWPQLEPRLRGFDAPPGPTGDTGRLIEPPVFQDQDARCGCAGPGPASWIALLGALGLVRSRRCP